ncbi:GNAT family N-acetyltransferase [Phytoactinopolyspora mesophila]|uniref:GNAT family N-acetyltransferase n=1 Tax=Phytoactinopolyspora mesophila TaxID=2650750 RepID=A0A7K3M0A3_9ACTN|nr:GNAT family N-acetyltransferase [Phytoactinopolyspora mesophila]NDL55888.1 GNAT family N-acetyltransferase [Phytoactinopolyspora mesophila]
MSTLDLRRATAADRPALERLWLMFSHDLSEYRGILPNPDSTFRSERLAAAFDDPDRAAYVLMSDEHPIGFAIVRDLSQPVRVLNSFFVVRGARRNGFGLRAVRDLVAVYPGKWEVAFQPDNVTAVNFWRRAAARLAGDAWTEEHRAVPGRADLPPDTWISFDTRTRRKRILT